jgi:hypothetical protein
MKIKITTEYPELDIKLMIEYAKKEKLLFNPSIYSSSQMAWDYLVCASKTKNELDLYIAVKNIEECSNA